MPAREMSVVLLHAHFDQEHLVAVTDEMRRLGPPTLRAIEAGDNCAYLLEGCHRARAAKALGLPITIEWVDYPQDETTPVWELLGNVHEYERFPVSDVLSRPGPSFLIEVEA